MHAPSAVPEELPTLSLSDPHIKVVDEQDLAWSGHLFFVTFTTVPTFVLHEIVPEEFDEPVPEEFDEPVPEEFDGLESEDSEESKHPCKLKHVNNMIGNSFFMFKSPICKL